MRTGDIVRTRGINVVFETATTRGAASFKAPKGSRFVFLVLGADASGNELDPKAILAALGYVPDPALATPSTDASGAEVKS